MRTRVLGMAVRILGALVALLALMTGGTMVALKTPWGGERLRRQVVARVNAQIQGRLEIGRLSFGGDRIGVWDVTLRDPDGQAIMQVAHAQVAFSIARLLRKEIRVFRGGNREARSPSVFPMTKASNLSRATAPRKREPARPHQPKKKTTEDGGVLHLDRFDLSGGDVSAAIAAEDSETTKVHVSGLGVFSGARYATGNGNWT